MDANDKHYLIGQVDEIRQEVEAMLPKLVNLKNDIMKSTSPGHRDVVVRRSALRTYEKLLDIGAHLYVIRSSLI